MSKLYHTIAPRSLTVSLTLLVAALLTTAAHAVDIELAWDAPTENADGSTLTDLAGYRVYRGATSGSYAQVEEAGTQTSFTLTGLQQGQVYFFATTAYDTSGNESAFSDELQWSMTAPVAGADTYSVGEDGTLTRSAGTGVLANDSDFEGDTLTATIVNNASNGSVTLNSDGSFTYTPAANFNGTDSFTYRADDGTLQSTPATVAITVTAENDAPQADALTIAATEDTPSPVTLTGTDLDGDGLTFVVVTGAAHGSLSGTAPNLTYTPDANYVGTDSFTYKANDGTSDSASATVAIDVANSNDAPTANGGSVSVDEDTALELTLAGSDLDGDSLSSVVVTQPAHGALTGTAPTLTYTPDANYNGGDAFTFKVNDGVEDSAPATVSITVNAINDTPQAQPLSVEVLEDGSLPITLSGSDIDGDSLSFIVTTQPSNGTLIGTAPNVTYVLNLDYAGPDSFRYRAHDGTANSPLVTVTINVIEVDDTPPAAPGGLRVHVL